MLLYIFLRKDFILNKKSFFLLTGWRVSTTQIQLTHTRPLKIFSIHTRIHDSKFSNCLTGIRPAEGQTGWDPRAVIKISNSTCMHTEICNTNGLSF